MEKAVLERLTTGDEGTFGVFSVWKLKFYSGELPWRNNQKARSCIPPGLYTVKWTYSPKFKRKTYEVQGVANRSGIRFHPANYVGDEKLEFYSEVNGCITLGLVLGLSMQQKAVLKSREAIAGLEEYFDGKDFQLEIKESFSEAVS